MLGVRWVDLNDLAIIRPPWEVLSALRDYDVLDAVVEDECNNLEAEADLDDHDEEDYHD
jgi:hypothetical protein